MVQVILLAILAVLGNLPIHFLFAAFISWLAMVFLLIPWSIEWSFGSAVGIWALFELLSVAFKGGTCSGVNFQQTRRGIRQTRVNKVFRKRNSLFMTFVAIATTYLLVKELRK